MSYIHLQEVVASKGECEDLSRKFCKFHKVEGVVVSRINRFDKKSLELAEYDTFFEAGSKKWFLREKLLNGLTEAVWLDGQRFKSYFDAELEIVRSMKNGDNN